MKHGFQPHRERHFLRAGAMILILGALIASIPGCNAPAKSPETTFRYVFSALVQNPAAASRVRPYFSARWQKAEKEAYEKLVASLPKSVKLPSKSTLIAAFSRVGERIVEIRNEPLGSTKARLHVRFVAGKATVLMTLEGGRWRIDELGK